MWRFHSGVWTEIGGDGPRINAALSATDSRYVAAGVLHDEGGTSIPIPGHLAVSSGKTFLFNAESVVGEWVYGYFYVTGEQQYAQPFRWKIGSAEAEKRGERGDYQYSSSGEQFISKVTGDRNGRLLVQTTPGGVSGGVFAQTALVIEPDGTRYGLNSLPNQPGYLAVAAAISEDGEVIGSVQEGNTPSSSVKAFSFAGGKLTLGPQGGFLHRQSGSFLFQAVDGKQFLWAPATGTKPAPVSPVAGALLALQNRNGQWLVSKDGGTATRLLTPKN